MKITLCEKNSIWNFQFFFKMLNTQNQTLVTIAYVHISVITPIRMVLNPYDIWPYAHLLWKP